MKFKWPYFGTAWGYSHMVGRTGSPTRFVHVDMTFTRSKVKVKLTGLLKLWKLPKIALFYVYLLRHFGMELKLMVDRDSTRPNLQLVGARFSNFLLKKWVQSLWNVDLTQISNGHISVLLEATVTWPSTLAILYVYPYWCDLDVIQCQGQGQWSLKFQKPDFWISRPQLVVTWLQSSRNVDITRIHCILSPRWL